MPLAPEPRLVLRALNRQRQPELRALNLQRQPELRALNLQRQPTAGTAAGRVRGIELHTFALLLRAHAQAAIVQVLPLVCAIDAHSPGHQRIINPPTLCCYLVATAGYSECVRSAHRLR